MPNPGFVSRLSVVQDLVPKVGTMLYEGTITYSGVAPGAVGGTIVGGAIVKTNKLSMLENAGVLGISLDSGTGSTTQTGTIAAGRVIGFGRGFGTFVGTNIGTVIADGNTLVIQLFQIGTINAGTSMPAKPVAAGSTILGTILVDLLGS